MEPDNRPSRRARAALPLGLMVATAIYLAEAFGTTSPYGGEVVSVRFFPILVAVSLVVALAVVLVQELRTPDAADAASADIWRTLRDPLKVVVLTAAFVAVFVPLGYVVATTGYVLGLLHVFGYTDVSWPRRLLATAVIVLLAYGLFEQVFGVRLPALPGLG